jgi:hypothetical protein
VIFAHLGFEQAIQFGETADPQRNIPFAVLGAMIIGAGPPGGPAVRDQAFVATPSNM